MSRSSSKSPIRKRSNPQERRSERVKNQKKQEAAAQEEASKVEKDLELMNILCGNTKKRGRSSPEAKVDALQYVEAGAATPVARSFATQSRSVTRKITRGKTPLGSNAQGDHIIAFTVLKSFLLSLDSIDDSMTHIDAAQEFIKKSKIILDHFTDNFDFNAFDKELNPYLESLKQEDAKVLQYKNNPDEAIGLTKMYLKSISSESNQDLVTYAGKQLELLDFSQSITSQQENLRSDVLGMIEASSTENYENNAIRALEIEEGEEVRKKTIKEIILEWSQQFLGAEEHNDISEHLKFLDRYLEIKKDALSYTRSKRADALFNLADFLSQQCAINIPYLTSPHYVAKYKNEQPEMKAGRQENNASEALRGISHLLRIAFHNSAREKDDIARYLLALYKAPAEYEAESLNNISRKRAEINQSKNNPKDNNRTNAARMIKSDPEKIYSLKCIGKCTNAENTPCGNDKQPLLSKSNSGDNKIFVHPKLQDLMAANMAALLHFPCLPSGSEVRDCYEVPSGNPDMSIFNQSKSLNNEVGLSKVLSLATFMIFNSYSGLKNIDHQCKSQIIEKFIENVLEKSIHSLWRQAIGDMESFSGGIVTEFNKLSSLLIGDQKQTDGGRASSSISSSSSSDPTPAPSVPSPELEDASVSPALRAPSDNGITRT